MNPTITEYRPYQAVFTPLAQRDFAPSKGRPQKPTHEQIAQCAYDIYIEHGRTDGRSERDWQQAEEELAHTATAAAHKAAVDRRA
jgi:hypothetical protein